MSDDKDIRNEKKAEAEKVAAEEMQEASESMPADDTLVLESPDENDNNIHASQKQDSFSERVQFLDMREPEQRARERSRERKQRNDALRAFSSTRNRSHIYHGTIVAEQLIERKSTEDRPYLNREWAAVVMYSSQVRVLIPFEEMFHQNPVDLSRIDFQKRVETEQYLRRQRSIIAGMNFLEVPFLVTSCRVNGRYDDEDYEVRASRANALKLIRSRSYSAENPRCIRKFGLYEAQISRVNRRSISVVLGGAERVIQLDKLTYRYIMDSDDLRKVYRVGAMIPVVVLDIIQKDGDIQIDLSARHAEMEFSKAKQGTVLRIGDFTTGTITRVSTVKDEQNRPRMIIYAWLDLFDMPAIATGIHPTSLGKYPLPGDIGRFEVVRFSFNGMTNVSCIGLDGSVGLYNRI